MDSFQDTHRQPPPKGEGTKQRQSQDMLSHDTARRALFVSPNDVLSPLLHSQGIPHMRELTRRGINFTMLTSERDDWNDEDRRHAGEIKQRLADWGIEWHALHIKPIPGVSPNLTELAYVIPNMLRLIRQKRIDVVHCRSYLPAFAMLLVRRLAKVRFLFDTRGFYPDEKILDGYWSRYSLRYRLSKRLEAKCFRHADAIIVTNDGMRDELLDSYSDPEERAQIDRKLSVIWNCVDTDRFRPDAAVRTAMRRQHGLDERFVALWTVGGIRPVHHMPAECIAFFRACQRHFGGALLLVLTTSPDAEELLKSYGLCEGEFEVRNVAPIDVPRFTQMADVGISFVAPRHHTSPVKLGEYLAAGVPAAVNRGQAGFDELVEAAGAGVVIRSCTPEGYAEAARELMRLLQDRQGLSERCRALADKKLSLHGAVDKYAEVYRSLFC